MNLLLIGIFIRKHFESCGFSCGIINRGCLSNRVQKYWKSHIIQISNCIFLNQYWFFCNMGRLHGRRLCHKIRKFGKMDTNSGYCNSNHWLLFHCVFSQHQITISKITIFQIRWNFSVVSSILCSDRTYFQICFVHSSCIWCN